MAFCSTCGATLNGPFCGKCGTPVPAGGQTAPPPQPQAPPPIYQSAPPPPYPGAPPPPQPRPTYQAPPPPQGPYQGAPPYQGPPPQYGQPMPMGMQPGPKKKSPVLLILGIIGGIMLLGILCVVGLGFYAAHKLKQAGFDPELMKNNPSLAVSKMVTAFNPDLEMIDHDDSAGTITLRDRKTGKIAKLRFDDARSGRFNMTFEEDGKDASVSIGGDVAKKLPSWVSAYPGAEMKGGFSATSSDENGNAGTFAFTTTDSADQVQRFYEGRAKDAGMEQKSSASAAGFGTVLTFANEGEHHTMTVTITGSNPTTVNVAYANK